MTNFGDDYLGIWWIFQKLFEISLWNFDTMAGHMFPVYIPISSKYLKNCCFYWSQCKYFHIFSWKYIFWPNSPSEGGRGHNKSGGKGSLVSIERSDHKEVPFSIKQSQMSSLSVLELSLAYILMKIPRGAVRGDGVMGPQLYLCTQ